MNKTVIGVVIIAGVAGAAYFLWPTASPNAESAAADQAPLYWVAPMDPNFRRDEPGKSPMGMDLVPVYASDESDGGTVRISAAIENNIGVKTAFVRRGHLPDTLSAPAYVGFNENRLWHAYPRVEGWIDELYVDTIGVEVSAGDALYSIYSPNLVNAQEDYASARRSNNRQLVASARARLEALDVSAEQIEKLDRTGEVDQSIVVRTPQDGVVSKLAVREGHYVTPGTAILEVAGLDDVWVTAELFERDAARVKLGDQIEVRVDALAGDVRRASIDFVSPVVDAISRTLLVRANVPNPEGLLKPNMFGHASVMTSAPVPALLVPRQALIRTKSQSRVVLSMGDGQFKSVAVQVGEVGTDDAEITSGLREGDRVVTSAQFLLDSESSIDSDFQRMDLAQASSMNHEGMNHEGMNHEGMNHEGMNHEGMNHEGMSHEGMNHEGMSHEGMNHEGMSHEGMNHEGMSHEGMNHEGMNHGTMGGMGNSAVWTTGEIKSINLEARTFVLTHPPIPEWQWPTMTMTMDAAETVNLESLKTGASYRLHMVEQPEASTGYVVMHAEPMTGESPQ